MEKDTWYIEEDDLKNPHPAAFQDPDPGNPNH